MLPWIQSVQKQFCQWRRWLNISRWENCPPSEGKKAVSSCQRPLAARHLLRPVHRLTQTISALGRKNENATIWGTSSRETNYIKTYIYDFVTLKRILLPANASFVDVFWSSVPHSIHLVLPTVPIFQLPLQAAQQNQPLWEAGGSSNSMLAFTSSRTLLCPGTCSCIESLARKLEIHCTMGIHVWKSTAFGRNPMNSACPLRWKTKLHSGRFIASKAKISCQMVAFIFWL